MEKFFLSIQFSQSSENEICLSQEKYVSSLLDDFSMQNCNGVTRQLPTILQLEGKGVEESIDRQLYQKVIDQLFEELF